MSKDSIDLSVKGSLPIEGSRQEDPAQQQQLSQQSTSNQAQESPRASTSIGWDDASVSRINAAVLQKFPSDRSITVSNSDSRKRTRELDDVGETVSTQVHTRRSTTEAIPPPQIASGLTEVLEKLSDYNKSLVAAAGMSALTSTSAEHKVSSRRIDVISDFSQDVGATQYSQLSGGMSQVVSTEEKQQKDVEMQVDESTIRIARGTDDVCTEAVEAAESGNDNSVNAETHEMNSKMTEHQSQSCPAAAGTNKAQNLPLRTHADLQKIQYRLEKEVPLCALQHYYDYIKDPLFPPATTSSAQSSHKSDDDATVPLQRNIEERRHLNARFAAVLTYYANKCIPPFD